MKLPVVVFVALFSRASCHEPPPAPEPSVSADPGGESSAPPAGTDGGSAPAQSVEPSEVGARHLLVMHRGSARASGQTRTREQALARAREALRRARAGEDFAALVREYSDEPGAGARGGSLGRFHRGMMVRAFEQAAFALGVGDLSDVVETEFGFHVIQRTE